MRSMRPLSYASLLVALTAGCFGPTRNPPPPRRDLAVVGAEDLAASDEDLALAPPADLAGQKPADLAGVKPADLARPVDLLGVKPVPLVVTPANFTLPVDGLHPNTVKYKATRNGVDVTGSVTFTVANAALGGFQSNLFTSAPAASGSTTVTATAGVDTGSTNLTLQVTKVVITGGAPSDAGTKFGGSPDATRAPEVVYPPDGVLVPANLNVLEIHFLPKGNDLFEIAFAGNGVGLKIYTKCNVVGAGCVFLPDEPIWGLLASGARDQTITMTIRGTTQAGGPVGAAAARKMTFSREDVSGGIYYWGAGNGGIYRYDFGLRGQKAESFYTPAQAGGAQCVGCHAMSRNGVRAAVGLNIPGPAELRILNVASRTVLYKQGGGGLPGNGGSNYEALTPDGTKIITTEKGGLTLRDAGSGALIGANPQVSNANMPDFSADGRSVVFARGANPCTFGICDTLGVSQAGIFAVPFTGTAFGQVKTIVPAGAGNNYYPSYSPDGNWVLYNHSSDKSYDAPDAQVFAVGANGGTVINLTRLNAGAAANSWPKVAPFIHHADGATIFWVTYSTRRPYGLRGGTASQLWMTAIDVAQLAAGRDGSYPPFWLPFQDFASGNHIAQWVEKVDRAPCTPQIDNPGATCMPGEICIDGFCQPRIQ